MSALRGAAMAAALIALAACYTSLPPSSDPAALSPHGVDARLVMANGRTVDGELLMIDDTSYVLETGGRIAIARYSDVRSAEFAKMGTMTVRARTTPAVRYIRAARARARFPYGIPASAMAALLAKAHQDTPDDLGTTAAPTR